jgi:hypothetical protein
MGSDIVSISSVLSQVFIPESDKKKEKKKNSPLGFPNSPDWGSPILPMPSPAVFVLRHT